MGKLKLKPEWLLTKEKRDEALAHKHSKMEDNLEARTKKLPELKVGDLVMVQNQKGKDALRWSPHRQSTPFSPPSGSNHRVAG